MKDWKYDSFHDGPMMDESLDTVRLCVMHSWVYGMLDGDDCWKKLLTPDRNRTNE